MNKENVEHAWNDVLPLNNEIMSFAVKWISLEITTLIKISQIDKADSGVAPRLCIDTQTTYNEDSKLIFCKGTYISTYIAALFTKARRWN